MIFVPDDDWVSVEDEKKRYQNHHNTIDNVGYVKFLEEVISVVSDSVKVSSRILDFGSGQTAVLTNLLSTHGYDCVPYDPNYDFEIEKDSHCYDSIILCEVIEHLRYLNSELALIRELLKTNGKLIVRTKLYPDDVESFTKWWYNKDITHINFFNKSTLDFMAGKMGLILCSTGYPDIFLLK